MKRAMLILAWGFIITALFVSIIYVVTSNMTSYFLYPTQGSILRETSFCKPIWVSVGLFSVDEVCHRTCQNIHNVDNYKIESLKCFCDVNNCKSME